VAHAGNTGTYGPKTAVDSSGQVTFQVLPGTNTFAAYDAGGYQTQTVTVSGSTTVTFATVTVTAQINDPDSTELAAASVAHAGNIGTFGPKTPVGNNGQVTFQVLPGTNTFTAYDAGGYQTQTITVTGPVTVTFATVAVTVIVDKDGSPLTTAVVAHAGNIGSYGPKTPVDGNGQVIFQVLPGTNSFTAYDGSAYASETITVTTATSTTISVS
jgi:VCBS repeat-containing protein